MWHLCGLYKNLSIFRADGIVQTGFIAHETADALGCGASGSKDAVDVSGAPVLQSLEPIAIMSVLVKAVQVLSAQVTDLQSQLLTIKGQMKMK